MTVRITSEYPLPRTTRAGLRTHHAQHAARRVGPCLALAVALGACGEPTRDVAATTPPTSVVHEPPAAGAPAAPHATEPTAATPAATHAPDPAAPASAHTAAPGAQSETEREWAPIVDALRRRGYPVAICPAEDPARVYTLDAARTASWVVARVTVAGGEHTVETHSPRGGLMGAGARLTEATVALRVTDVAPNEARLAAGAALDATYTAEATEYDFEGRPLGTRLHRFDGSSAHRAAVAPGREYLAVLQPDGAQPGRARLLALYEIQQGRTVRRALSQPEGTPATDLLAAIGGAR